MFKIIKFKCSVSVPMQSFITGGKQMQDIITSDSLFTEYYNIAKF